MFDKQTDLIQNLNFKFSEDGELFPGDFLLEARKLDSITRAAFLAPIQQKSHFLQEPDTHHFLKQVLTALLKHCLKCPRFLLK